MLTIGLMSGTSVDGIDAALIDITQTQPLQFTLLNHLTHPYPPEVRSTILQTCSGVPLSMADFAALDNAIAQAFAQAAIAVNSGFPKAALIGSHGQTVYHQPPPNAQTLGYSLQIGRGELIAHLTQIETINNFRAADLAALGQGAPLVPPVDAALLSHPKLDRAIQNIGGIGNVTYLPAHQTRHQNPDRKILGWDTGPGNMLLDLAVTQLTQGEKTYDQDGAWAASGVICETLVDRWLTHPFFQTPPPKSTGRELFSADYLQTCQQEAGNLIAADFLASLTELTARSIVLNYQTFLPALPHEVFVCGGGSRNQFLMSRLQTHLPHSTLSTTDTLGLNSDAKEAIAFAILAYWRKNSIPGNLPEVTGATHAVLLGEIHQVLTNLAC
jgi:anhydro-N-acetylmuramic acid kinase